MAKKKSKNTVFENAIVEKRNVLNEIRKNSMSTQELRFFSIYLSKINARDPSTRVVRFPLEDFRKIMEIGADMNMNHFRNTFHRLLQQIVDVPNENGYGFSSFQLFKRCKLYKNEYNEWYVEIDAHDDALPLMFEFKKNYFSYELWNALRLNSINQIRMYEILKQYEYVGKRELTITELRELLGIKEDEYKNRWNNFKIKVLDSCQQALAENTDICFTYEKGKSGTGGKWLTIIFRIFKNENYKDPLTLDEFIELKPKDDVIVIGAVSSNEISKEYIELYDKYFKDRNFTKSETESILNKLIEQINSSLELKESIEFYLQNLIAAYDGQLRHQTLNNKVGYLIGMIKNNAFIKTEPTYRQREETSYDINEFEKLAINYEAFIEAEQAETNKIEN